MAEYIDGDRILYFEEYGSKDAPSVLLIAPGGMKSAISFWNITPWNPVEQLADDFHVVAMDQRNAGRSSAPINADDGWHTYSQDQLDLMDHLGIKQFHVAGMCIGGPYAFGLIAAASERILSAVLFQTIGRDNNRSEFYEMFDQWAEPLMQERDTPASAWSSFRENMYGGDRVFFNVDEAFVAEITTPLLVLMGNDVYHPQISSRLVAKLARNVEFVEHWTKDRDKIAAMDACYAFLENHS